ncbi:MAG: hypothetical protein L6Q69_11185 [Zoogloea sp.]|nr:hypothetical protein [Zoogloea sp.]
MNNGNLTEIDHKAMDSFLEKVLDWYKTGEITRSAAIGGLAHVMTALAKDNTAEAVSWFQNADVSYFKN